MRIHRFLISDSPMGIKEDATIEVTNEGILHQWRSVLRFEPGTKMILLDNSGLEFEAELVALLSDRAQVLIKRGQTDGPTPKRELFLFHSVIKKDKLEWVLEKGTEIGISHFRPLLSERSETKGFDFERARRIIRESSEQCGRSRLPAIYDTISLEKVLADYNMPMVAFHPEGKMFKLADVASAATLGIFIGPEGGWSDGDLERFKKKGVGLVSVGPQILRAETAAIAVASLLLLEY